MKQISSFCTILLTGVLVLILLSLGLPKIPVSAESNSAVLPAPVSAAGIAAQAGCDSSRSIQVSGTAVVNVAPDRALVQLGVQSNGATTREVEELNASAIKAVIKSAMALGVEAKDISTDWYVIEPVYDNYDSLTIRGYRIHNIVAITLRDVSKTNAVISAALVAGANQVINVDLYTSELRKYRDQARDLAMKAAQEKAQALAQAAGAQAGCVLAINENTSSTYNGWWYGRSQNLMTQNVVQNVTPSAQTYAATGEEPVSLGLVSVRAEINASFGLK